MILKPFEHDPTIFNIKSPEFYINMKKSDIPPRGHRDRQAFVDLENKKCTDGLTVNGIYIPGSFYYDFNFHVIELDDNGRSYGTAKVRDNGWIIHNDFYQAQQNKEHYCVAGSRQLGKELIDSQLLLKSDGSTVNIGSIKVGEKLLGRDGKETTVLGVYPQGIKPIYRITFADGRVVDAGLEHKWGMYSSYGFYKVVTTQEMLKDFKSKHPKSGYNYKYYLPEIDSIDYQESQLPLNSYVLGQLIGNGGLTTETLTINTGDKETINLLNNLLPDYKILPDKFDIKNNNPINKHTIVQKVRKENIDNFLKYEIKKLGLNVKSGFKFIPEIYKKSSTKQRLDLVAGLLDSDGWISSDGQAIEFKTKSERLANDLIEVLRSLGIRCQKGVIQAVGILQNLPNNKNFLGDSNYYRVYIRSSYNLFKLKRKSDRFKPRKNILRVPVTNIEYLCDEKATCITVDNDEHLFLTDSFVPTHNSDILVSLTMHEVSVYDNTTGILLFTSSKDQTTFTNKMKIAHDHLVDFLKVPLLDKDFNKDVLRFGYKETNNDNELHARLYLYNTAGGHNTEVGAGTTVTFFAFDEIAKGSFRKAFNAVLPAFRGKDGFRNAAFTAFTGGNTEKSIDAEKFFLNPASSEILNIGGTGRFLDGTYRADFKKTTSFAEYLRHTTGQEIPSNSELETIECFYADFDEANKLLDAKEENLLKAGDTDAYYNEKIYYPRKISDMFLKENSNPFSHLSSELERLYEYLETQDYHTQTYEFNQIGETLELVPVSQHYDPFSKNLDQPLVIIDKPRDLGKGKLYVLGADLFNINKTGTSPSRGSFYIMRKSTTDYKDPYQDTMVGWYNGRRDINHFRQTLFNTLKYFGADLGSASLLHEAADDSLTQWYMDKKKGFYLEDTYALSKQIFSNTKAVAAKGLRPTPRNQAYGLDRLLEYLEEEMPDGRKGLWRIKDKLLVKQLLRFDGALGDCDAIVGFFHTLIHLYKEKNYIVKVNSAENKDSEKVEKIIADYNAFGFQLKVTKTSMKRSII